MLTYLSRSIVKNNHKYFQTLSVTHTCACTHTHKSKQSIKEISLDFSQEVPLIHGKLACRFQRQCFPKLGNCKDKVYVGLRVLDWKEPYGTRLAPCKQPYCMILAVWCCNLWFYKLLDCLLKWLAYSF